MKKHFTAILLLVSISCLGQGREFKDLEEFSHWVVNYYKDPEPHHLFDAFKYMSGNEEVGEDKIYLLVFFASSLRNDTSQQSFFFSQLKETTNQFILYDFGLTLWLIQSEHSSGLLEKFYNLKQIDGKAFQQEFELLDPDIWADPIGRVKMESLWFHFYGSGDDKSIIKIISVLKDLNPDDPFSNSAVIAYKAQVDLANHAVEHDKVLAICKKQRDRSDNDLKSALNEIIKAATAARKKLKK